MKKGIKKGISVIASTVLVLGCLTAGSAFAASNLSMDGDTSDWSSIGYESIPAELKHSATAGDFWYTPTWNSETQITDFTGTPEYYEYIESQNSSSDSSSSSSDYSWDSGSSWDSDSTDWGSDW